MERISERHKVDIGLLPQTLNNTNATGRYHSMRNYLRAWAIVTAGAAADTKTTKIEIFEATSAAGAGAQLISGATATVTCPTKVTKATAALSTVLAGTTITINGLVFTAHASATTKANREFSIGGTDTADGDELVSCINDPDYGVPGVTASNSSGTLTLTATDPGEAYITLAQSSNTFTFAQVEAVAYVHIDATDLSAGYTHIAAKVTTTGNTPVAVTLVREARAIPCTQYVGASASI